MEEIPYYASIHSKRHLDFFCIITILASGCQQQEILTANNKSVMTNALNEKIGWLHGNCIAIKKKILQSGEKLTVISLGESQFLYEAEIIEPTQSSEKCFALLEGRKDVNVAEGYYFYKVTPPKQGKLNLGIGLIDLKPKIYKKNEMIYGDINGDGHNNYFTQCSTSEGVQFNIWSDGIYKGDPIWSGYYYLDYTTEENCP